jgi:hypothetical protein
VGTVILALVVRFVGRPTEDPGLPEPHLTPAEAQTAVRGAV